MVFKMRTFDLGRARAGEECFFFNSRPLRRFSFGELKTATDNFSKANIIGSGGFGKVYKAHLLDGTPCAVKRMKRAHTEAEERQFRAEMEFQGLHRNLLRLYGFCCSSASGNKERILVYPFFCNGSVASNLRPEGDRPPLDWPKRRRIALQVSQGLCYMHHECVSTIVHRDVKASNVLLDEDFEVAICDFGLAKIIGRDADEHQRQVQQLPSSSAHVPEIEEMEEESEEEEEKDESTDRSGCCNDPCASSCFNMFTRTMSGSYENANESIQLPIRAKTQVDPNEKCTWFSGAKPCWQCSPEPEIDRESNIADELQQQNVPMTPDSDPDEENEFTHVISQVRGTAGHIAPEYLVAGKCSVKNDVFGYGIFLLELVTGKRALDVGRLLSNEDAMLLNWVTTLVRENKMQKVVDPVIIDANVDVQEVERLVRIALLCTQHVPAQRPTMSEVTRLIGNELRSTR